MRVLSSHEAHRAAIPRCGRLAARRDRAPPSLRLLILGVGDGQQVQIVECVVVVLASVQQYTRVIERHESRRESRARSLALALHSYPLGLALACPGGPPSVTSREVLVRLRTDHAQEVEVLEHVLVVVPTPHELMPTKLAHRMQESACSSPRHPRGQADE